MTDYCYTCEIISEITGEVEPCWCNDEWRAYQPAPLDLKEQTYA